MSSSINPMAHPILILPYSSSSVRNRLEIQKMITPQFIIAHSFLLGAQIPNMDPSAIYDFSSQVVLPGNQMLIGRLGHGGAIDGRFHFGLGDKAIVKLVASLQPNSQKDSYQVKYK